MVLSIVGCLPGVKKLVAGFVLWLGFTAAFHREKAVHLLPQLNAENDYPAKRKRTEHLSGLTL